MNDQIQEHTYRLIQDCIPSNSIDCVILGYEEQQIKVLLLKWKQHNIWSLPGGFIKKTEDLDDAAHRILAERTGLKSIFLEQFHTFGNKERSRLNTSGQNLNLLGDLKEANPEFLKWIQARFISHRIFCTCGHQENKSLSRFSE